MSCSVQLRVAGTLLDFARVLRLLKRYSASPPRVRWTGEGHSNVAMILATVPGRERSRTLTTALARVPAVLDAVILETRRAGRLESHA
jgi:hypothetical protein